MLVDVEVQHVQVLADKKVHRVLADKWRRRTRIGKIHKRSRLIKSTIRIVKEDT